MGMIDTIRRLNLLIVDDDEVLAGATKRALAGSWKDVKAVHTVSQALAEIATEQYHVVLSDWDMPGGGGQRIVERSSVPVVVYTGGWMELPGVKEAMAGAAGALQKPANRHDLNVALYQAVSAKSWPIL